MSLALFDLDETLINGDSDHLWMLFLVENQLIDDPTVPHQRDKFKQQYHQGVLDIYEYIEFVCGVLNSLGDRLFEIRENFIQDKIIPILQQSALDLISQHKNQGDTTIIISATNHFVVEKIAALHKVDHTIATDLEIKEGFFTGKPIGVPSFREGKITRCNEFIEKNPQFTLGDSYFYSDSLNDIPLLKEVSHPVAVDPDSKLKKVAEENNWKIISLKD